MTRTLAEMLHDADAAVPRITPREAAQLISDRAVVVIDVREASEIERSGKVKDALHIPRGLLEFQADPASASRHPLLRPDRPVLLYCGSGARAALAGQTLKELGYLSVRNLGGFGDWVAAGGETETGQIPAPVSGGQQNADLAAAAAPGPLAPGDDLAARQDQLLDEAVQETFPASDPISPKRIT
ncbi:rhodanese-like domain-containing protein [Roseomonas chloroacetimidivorans]|jgi:rhodanese-related sulfurtransferase|uniref:rhodanese-like domain-containing protein n=1 Tax=Roseomonas chloroacetimidivorans TaxID=1766656 RepID=UPI003C756976